MSYKLHGYIWGMLFLAPCSGAWAAGEITLHYNERPPYLVSEASGGASGLTASPAGEAFKKAGIPFKWAKTPSNRQLAILEQNAEKDCAVGWFKTPAREAFALFTKPIYRDKPWTALTNPNFKVPAGIKLADLLADKKTRLLVKESYSYGTFIDDLVKKLKPTTTAVTLESPQMIQMIKADRADLTFVSPEEAGYFISQAGLSSSDVKTLNFPDVPQGEYRYIMCSKQVGAEVIEKLNKAISFQ